MNKRYAGLLAATAILVALSIGAACSGSSSSTATPSPTLTVASTAQSSPTTASFTVYTVFSDGNSGSVSVSLSCLDGIVTNSPQPASVALPAKFTVTGIPAAGTTCSASEVASPAGYTESDDCSSINLSTVILASCTITNTLNASPTPLNASPTP